MSQYLSSVHGVYLVLWSLIHPKLNILLLLEFRERDRDIYIWSVQSWTWNTF